ncbi:ankyrin repeat domain-containing protein, partial [Verrucomicrobia bacterium]|nr:ankyrin repeat domain-containing protein [Verrucomicrobiota bacterium]
AQVQKPAPQAATSKKSKSPIAKWAIASVFGIVLVILVMVFSGGSNDVSTLELTTAKAERKQQQELPAGTSQPQPPEKPFYDRAMMGDIEAVKQHLAAGTGVNTQNKNGRTALHWATVNGHKDIVELLINEGADVNLKDLAGETPLDWIGALSLEEAYLPEAKGEKIKSVKDEIANLLRKHGAKTGEELKAEAPEPPDISIQAAAGTGNIIAVKQHISAGTDVNAKKRDGYTALQSAARHGHTEVAEFLIEKGADVNAKGLSAGTTGTRVVTALDWAIFNKHTETADLLRKHGGKTSEELK